MLIPQDKKWHKVLKIDQKTRLKRIESKIAREAAPKTQNTSMTQNTSYTQNTSKTPLNHLVQCDEIFVKFSNMSKFVQNQ